MVLRPFAAFLVFSVLSCSTPPAPRPAEKAKPPEKTLAAAPAPPSTPEPPLAEFVTGALKPNVSNEPIEIVLSAKYTGQDFEILKFAFRGQPAGSYSSRDVVVVPGATSAFVAGDYQNGTLWIRRPSERAREPITGNLLTRAETSPGVRYSFVVKPGGPDKPGARALEAEWLAALGATVDYTVYFSNPASDFIQRRLREMAEKHSGRPRARGAATPPVGRPESELYLLMETTTGRNAVQQAIQHQNALAVSFAREKRTLPLSAVKARTPPPAPYLDMLSALGRQPPAEQLAAAAPADFWFLRARSFDAFFELLGLAESWGQPTADMLAGRSEDRGTTERYTAELALERTELARVFGPSVIDSVAVVGSDPYIHDGTDLTFVFKVTAPPLFEAALAKALARHAAAHGDVKQSSFVHEGVTIQVARSADGRVRQHRASVAGFELVSNSPAAIRRVISAARQKAPRLADEPDFRYLTARDAGAPDEVMLFLSDRFVESVVGPAQKIAQARRQLALAELSTPGYAALLFGTIHGNSPKDDKELVKSGELLASELKHADGAPIAFRPGGPARSRWGTTTHLEPLIDLPPVEKISASEQGAYEWFMSAYAPLWSEYMDPILVRFGRSKESPKKLEVALRALPLYRGDNRQLIEAVGSARVDVPPLATGFRWVLALGKDADLRRELDGHARFAGKSFSFDWLGDSVTLGIADRNELANAAQIILQDKLGVPSERGKPDELDLLYQFPVYAVVEVKNRVGAVVAFGTLRKMADDVAHEMLDWRDGGRYRDVPITDVAVTPSGMLKQGGHVYYALCPNALIFSLNRSVLERLIDAQLDGKAPRGLSDSKRRDLGQLVVELGTKKDGALIRTIGWLAAYGLIQRSEQSREAADVILRGAPEARASGEAFRKLARAYFGHVPLTPDGRLYEYSPEGIRDPVRGTEHAPIFPATPVPGSPLAQALERFVRLRSSTSFDIEPASGPRELPLRSLSVRLELELR